MRYQLVSHVCLAALVLESLCITYTPTPTATPVVNWKTNPDIVVPEQRFSITLVHPYGIWNDPDAIGFAKQEIDIVELQRNPDTWVTELPGDNYCNASIIQEPLDVGEYGVFPQFTRTVIAFPNIVLTSGQYTVCRRNASGWFPFRETLVIQGPATYTTQPMHVLAAESVDMWFLGEALTAGDRWSIVSLEEHCVNGTIVANGTIRYSEINLPYATRAVVTPGAAPAAGRYQVCYKYRTTQWLATGNILYVNNPIEPSTYFGATTEGGYGLHVRWIVVILTLGLCLAVALALCFYCLWSRHAENAEAIRTRCAVENQRELLLRLQDGTHPHSPVHSQPVTKGGIRQMTTKPRLDPVDTQIPGRDLEIVTPSPHASLMGHEVSMPHPNARNKAFIKPSRMDDLDQAVKPHVASRRGSTDTAQYYYDPTTGNYWAYVQGGATQQVPKGQLGVPNYHQTASQASALYPGQTLGLHTASPSIAPSVIGPPISESPAISAQAGDVRPRKGNWLKPSAIEQQAYDELRQQSRMQNHGQVAVSTTTMPLNALQQNFDGSGNHQPGNVANPLARSPQGSVMSPSGIEAAVTIGRLDARGGGHNQFVEDVLEDY